MLQIVASCDASQEPTGAAFVATLFLGIFATLILLDMIWTALALHKALYKDERETELASRIKELRAQLQRIKSELESATAHAAQRHTSRLVPIKMGSL